MEWLEQYPAPLDDIRVGAAVFRVLGREPQIAQRSFARAEIPGVARITDVSAYESEREKIPVPEGAVDGACNVGQEGQQGRIVYDAKYAQYAQDGQDDWDADVEAGPPYYLFPNDVIRMTETDVVELEWIGGLRFAIRIKEDVLGGGMTGIRIAGAQEWRKTQAH